MIIDEMKTLARDRHFWKKMGTRGQESFSDAEKGTREKQDLKINIFYFDLFDRNQNGISCSVTN